MVLCLDSRIYSLNRFDNGNNCYIKRDDLLPFSFGGNKARKGVLFFEDWRRKKSDCILTYGSSSSNHCRVIANLAIIDNLPCHIITPKEQMKDTFNRKIITDLLEINKGNGTFHYCNMDEVGATIERVLADLKKDGYNPYFVPGGGHGNIGTQAYVNCYGEIRKHEADFNVKFDYIFHPSGTGTTQAGLVCGKLLNGDDVTIVGISIARDLSRGRDVIIQSVTDYLDVHEYATSKDVINDAVIFTDDYICGGYGRHNQEILNTIKSTFMNEGIALDSVYTGKAFWGMEEYIRINKIENKTILFIHTGGQPIFFDELRDTHE
jgi:D-cysteine desulfhydrase